MRVSIVLVAVAFALYSVAGFYGVPHLMTQQLRSFESGAPGRTATIGSMTFNPYTLVARVTQLRLSDADAGVALDVAEMSVELSAHSLLERRPIISVAELTAPHLTLASLLQTQQLNLLLSDTLLDAFAIRQLQVRNGTLATAGNHPLALEQIELTMTDLDRGFDEPAQFTLASVTAAGGQARASGTLAPDLASADGRLTLRALDLDRAAILLDESFSTVPMQGVLDLDAAFAATMPPESPEIVMTEASLTLSDLMLAPSDTLRISTARVDGAGNLTLKHSGGQFDLAVSLQLDAGRLSIVALELGTEAFDLDDTSLFATADPGDRGLTLSLDGQLRNGGSTALTVRAASSASVNVSLRSEQVSAGLLSQYTQVALDRALIGGSADVALDFTHAAGRVNGSLQLTGHALDLARTADDASTAPLDMARALLEDRDRRIQLDLTFAGTQSVLDATASALRARLSALTAAPFTALASLASEDAGPVSAVPFVPGDAALSDTAQPRIDRLAAALEERPLLGIRIAGGYDPVADRNALARQQIELHVQLATAGPGAPQSRPAPVDFDSVRVRDVLDEFAAERLPAEQTAELDARLSCEGEFAEVCKRSYYGLIFDALVANEDIGSTTLSRLGRFRAQSLADALRARGIQADRIAVTTGETVQTAFGIGLPVELVVTTAR